MITNPTNVSVNVYSYISTVFKKSDFFTDSEVDGAWKVPNMQQHIYWSGTSNFKTYLREVIIRN